MKISYGKTVYVGQTPRGVLDYLATSVNTVATGDGVVVVDRETLNAFVEEYKEDCDIRMETVTSIQEETGHFVIELLEKLEGEVFGEVSFSL